MFTFFLFEQNQQGFSVCRVGKGKGRKRKGKGKSLRKIYRNTSVGNYMFKVNNRNVTTRCEVCSKLTIKTPERRQ